MSKKHAAILAVAVTLASVPACAPAPLNGTLIVLNKSGASASLVDVGTGGELLKLPTGAGPHEIAVSPDGRTAVVADYGSAERPGHTLTVIDLPGAGVVKTVNLEGYHRPHGIQFHPDGTKVFVTAEQEQVVLIVDVGAGKVVQAVPTGQDVSHMLVLSPDAKRCYVANIGSGSVTVIDAMAGEAIVSIPTGAGAEGIDISPDGGEVWVSNRSADTLSVIDTESLEAVDTIPCAEFPIRLKFTADGRHVLVSNARSGDVAVFDAATRREIDRISMKIGLLERRDSRLMHDGAEDDPEPVGILVTPDGGRAYVAGTNADIVTLLNLKGWNVAGRLVAGQEPDGLGYSPIVLDRANAMKRYETLSNAMN